MLTPLQICQVLNFALNMPRATVGGTAVGDGARHRAHRPHLPQWRASRLFGHVRIRRSRLSGRRVGRSIRASSRTLSQPSCDVGYAIYSRYATVSESPMGGPSAVGMTSELPVSYVAHLTGALAGLTIGLIVLKNFEQKLHEQLLWWVALGVYAACTIFAILFNVMNPVEDRPPMEDLGDGVGGRFVSFGKVGV
nr:unnamed protein product [Callosobruchus chinensis]